MEQKRRLYFYDNVKALLIILVVIGHFVDIATGSSRICRCVFGFIYTFHMPLFIFISGLFHKDENIFEKALTDIFIGFALKIALFCTGFILYRNTEFHLLSDGGVPWFMFVLAVYEVASYYLRRIDKKFLLIVFVIIGCFVGYDSTIGDYLYLSRIFVFFPFYILGQMIDKNTLMEICSKRKAVVISWVVLACWLALFFFSEYPYKLRYLFTGRNPFEKYADILEMIHIYGGCFRLLCYVLTAITGFAVLCIVPKKNLGLLTVYGQRTIQVFFWHPVILRILNRIGVGEALVSTHMGIVVWVLCAIFIALLTGLRFFSFPVKQIKAKCRR